MFIIIFPISFIIKNDLICIISQTILGFIIYTSTNYKYISKNINFKKLIKKPKEAK